VKFSNLQYWSTAFNSFCCEPSGCKLIQNLIKICYTGTDSPQAVRKIMLLSDKVRSRDVKKKAAVTHSAGLVVTPKSPGPPVSLTSPQQRRQHHRLPAVDLSLESSSVTGRASAPSSSSLASIHSMFLLCFKRFIGCFVTVFFNDPFRWKIMLMKAVEYS